ncbi:MAG: hypothetical protein JXR70_18500 [Spirochaetales bacterium]|nr:hypothetical protein [Spirochaetales bacterium]
MKDVVYPLVFISEGTPIPATPTPFPELSPEHTPYPDTEYTLSIHGGTAFIDPPGVNTIYDQSYFHL